MPTTDCDIEDPMLPKFVKDNTNLDKGLKLENCQLDCPIDVRICEAVSNMFICSAGNNTGEILLKNVTLSILNNTECNRNAKVHLMTYGRPLTLAPGCSLDCQVTPVAEQIAVYASNPPIVQCSRTDGDKAVTNIVYFIFRALGTMCLACNFVLLDAQTISMCKVEEDQGRKGALGRQYVFQV